MSNFFETKKINNNDQQGRDSQQAQEINTVSQNKMVTDLDQELRVFTFHDKIGEQFEISTKKIGGINEIYNNLNKGKTEEKKVESPKNLATIIKAFKNHRRLITNNENKEINKSPHLLISGGFVRDVLTNQIPNDIDLITNMPSSEIYSLVKNLSNIKSIGVHGESSEVVRVKFRNGEEYEISSFKNAGEKNGIINPSQDAGDREFTANALFYNPLSGQVIDYVGGIKDIEKKRIRFTGSAKKRIDEDGIRMMRYIRFLYKTGFSAIDEDREVVRKLAPKIKKEATERIKTELDRILQLASADKIIETFDDLGLLEQIFPEVKKLQNCKQGPPYHMEGDVYKHTLLVLEKLPKIASSRLKWATIFHDIAKPETREETEKDGKNKVSFLQHDQVGADKAGSILKRANFSNKEIEDIKWLIANHQMLFQKVSNRVKESDEKNHNRVRNRAKAVFKKMIMSKGIELVDDLVKLAIADSQGKISKEGDNKQDQEIIKEIFNEAKRDLKESEKNGVDFKKLINGKIIMEALNIKPSSEIGKIKKQILDILLESGENFDSEDLAKTRIRELILEFKK